MGTKQRKPLDMIHQSFITAHANRQTKHDCLSLCFKQKPVQNSTLEQEWQQNRQKDKTLKTTRNGNKAPE